MKHISEPQKDQYRGDINVLKLCASDNIHMYVFIYVWCVHVCIYFELNNYKNMTNCN